MAARRRATERPGAEAEHAGGRIRILGADLPESSGGPLPEVLDGSPDPGRFGGFRPSGGTRAGSGGRGADRGQRFGGERGRLTPPLPRPLTREAPEDAPDAFGGGLDAFHMGLYGRLYGRKLAGFAGGRDVRAHRCPLRVRVSKSVMCKYRTRTPNRPRRRTRNTVEKVPIQIHSTSRFSKFEALIWSNGEDRVCPASPPM